MTLLLLLPLFLYSFFSPSLPSPFPFPLLKLLLWLGPPFSLFFPLPCFSLLLLSWEVPGRGWSWDPGTVMLCFQSCFAGLLRGSEQVQPQNLIFSWARNFALLGNKEANDSKSFVYALGIMKIKSFSCLAILICRKETTNCIWGGKMFLHATSISTAGGPERLVLEGRMKLLQCEFWAVEENCIMSVLMGQPLCHPITLLTESSWSAVNALQFIAMVFKDRWR